MAIVATTNTMKATGTRPIVDVMISVTSPLISPPGTSRRTKAKPCRAMNIASVAATGVNLRNWISDPLISPTPKATTAISTSPKIITGPARPSLMKNEPTTTSSPDSGPTDRSMPPSSTAIVWPMAMNPSAVHSSITDVVLNAER